MIIQTRGRTALLITQPDHAALAARMMQHWRDGGLPEHPRRESILLSIAEHDNGWREVDRAPVLDAKGRMLDFVDVPVPDRQAIWPRGVGRLAHNPWAAALVAHHAVHVYRRYRDDPAWAAFFPNLEATRNRHVDAVGSLTLDDLLKDYFFLRMGDLLSLTFCNAWSEAPDEFGYAIRGVGNRLTVTPDPFDGQEIGFDVPAREVPGGPFTSADEAARAFHSASPATLDGALVGERANL